MFKDELNQHVDPVWPKPTFITLGLLFIYINNVNTVHTLINVQLIQQLLFEIGDRGENFMEYAQFFNLV